MIDEKLGPATATMNVFEIDEECLDAVRLFLACGTQWRMTAVSGLGGGAVFRTGLDYPAVQSTAAALSIQWNADTLSDLQEIEQAALSAWTDEQARARRDAERRTGRGRRVLH